MAVLNGPGRASIIGTGLIGGSIGLALRSLGWAVSGTDADPAAERRALEIGAIDEIGIDPDSTITFVAVPARLVAAQVERALAETRGAVTDVGGVKASVVAAIDDPRFVGGHPMAGSEQLGVDGARRDLFEGAVWVLTPVAGTDSDRYATVTAVVHQLGAESIALSPEHHDALVAVVSHVPHLTAAALMGLAAERSVDHSALLRLAAGGFRDMTRIAAGAPSIWPDICTENRDAIVEVLDRLSREIDEIRTEVLRSDRDGILARLEAAQEARRNLPSRVVQPDQVAEVRVPVPDRDGVIAEVATLASELSINIADIEVAHSSAGDRGVLILLVEAERADLLRVALGERGYRPNVTHLT